MENLKVEDIISQASMLASEATRISTQLYQKTKELGTTTSYYDTESSSNILEDLESSYDAKKLVALQKLLALMTKGEDVSSYFAPVIKNVASSSFPVKRLIYLYLLHYAEIEPDLTLLSINTIQKDLNDQNAIVRSVALRTLTSIKVEAVSEVVLSALRACSVDLSPFVRKCAATSLVKVSELDRSKIDILMDLLVILLQDSSGMVLAPAISALNKLFPSRTDLLHKHYRRICGILRNCNEFDQLVLIETLEIYSRQYLKDPRDSERKDWDQDFEIFVKECEYLLCSSNPGVVMKISNLIFQLRDMQLKALATKAIVRLFSRPRFEKIVLLGFTVDMVRIDPTPWFDHLSYFYCLTDDRDDIVSLKLNVLELLKTTSNRISIMMELECYSKCQNQYLATASVLAWRNLAITFPDLADQTLLKMVMLLSSKNVDLVGQIIVAIRRLLRETKNSSASQEYVIESLLPVYSTVEVPLAKSSILWLISQNPKSKYASDAVRIALKSFAKEDARVKKQILTTSIVVWLQNQLGDDLKLQSFAAMALKYCLKLAQFDIDYDVRDHGRVVNGLRGVTMKRPALIRKVIDILTRNDIVSDEKQPQSDVYLPGSQFRPGTLSNWLNQRIDGYEDHLAWTLVTTFSEERNVVVKKEHSNSPNKAVVNEAITPKHTESKNQKVLTLDEFYADVEPSSQEMTEEEDFISTSDSEEDSSNQ